MGRQARRLRVERRVQRGDVLARVGRGQRAVMRDPLQELVAEGLELLPFELHAMVHVELELLREHVRAIGWAQALPAAVEVSAYPVEPVGAIEVSEVRTRADRDGQLLLGDAQPEE